MLHQARAREPGGLESRPSLSRGKGPAPRHGRRPRRLLRLARHHSGNVSQLRRSALYRPHAPKRQNSPLQGRRRRVHQKVPLHQKRLELRGRRHSVRGALPTIRKICPDLRQGAGEKRPHYLFFLNYPDGVRRTLSTTNAVEAINKQLEILRRNSGGYFHSEETAKLKLGIAVTSLESGRWRSVAASVTAALAQFNAMFEARFEAE